VKQLISNHAEHLVPTVTKESNITLTRYDKNV